MGSEGNVNSKEDEKSGGKLKDKGSDDSDEGFGGYGLADFWNDESEDEDGFDWEEEVRRKTNLGNGDKTSRKRKRGLDRDEGEEEEEEFTALAKLVGKQGRRTGALMIKERCFDDDDGDFLDDAPAVREKSKTTSSRRRKKFVVLSDSDSVSPKSSDFDYTSLQEEKANELFGNPKTSLSSSVFSKKIEEQDNLQRQRKSSRGKGKEKIGVVESELARQICIICLSKEGRRRFRGTLDCCNHFFCFTCIRKWAKVESSCPLCKRRFGTICKNPQRAAAFFKQGFKTSKTARALCKQWFKRTSKPERAVAGVDLRSEVYQPPEADTNENVICSQCNQGGDDDLMLLCGVCKSSAHTYCVGLGRVVPEGNWCCDGCRPVAP